MNQFEPGTWIWKPDQDYIYVPAKVQTGFNRGQPATVETEDGEEFTIPGDQTKDLVECDPQCLKPIENMVKLNDLNEPAILHDLRLRFEQDDIYTYVSSILIAVNPFKMLPIYTPEILDQYKDQNVRDLPPHIFAIADNAYNNMLADGENQSVIISGESGAGKTESMKLILQYLAEVSGRAQGASGNKEESLEQQILKSNPVMEAFGNAKTLRNNNSSRFGKWTEVQFNKQGAIIGGKIINYLLEKSRIPFQAEGERNYHVFYQLLAGAEIDPALRKRLHLKDVEDFHYLNQSGTSFVEGINDEKDFEDLKQAMEVLNMTPEEIDSVFKTVAAVLHVGNIKFEGNEDSAKITNPECVKLVAELLDVDNDLLRTALSSRKMGVRSVVHVPYNLQQGTDARDAFAKTVYGKMFDWLICKINEALGKGLSQNTSTNDQTSLIGVLDIFGFESFETNSFEQLCINYCNEKLQFHFNDHIFRMEQDEYKSEGIPVDNIQFIDNQPCLDLLEMRGTGVFSMIDEEINVPKGSDAGFLSKVFQKHNKHQNLIKPKPRALNSRECFNIKHYAGEVSYNSTNFLEKNKDSLHQDLQDCLRTSSNEFVKKLLDVQVGPKEEAKKAAAAPAGRPGPRRRGGGGARNKKMTLGTQFKNQLHDLMQTLNKTSPHFIRCMKPNHVKKGDIFEAQMILNQLRYAGLLEVCRIRQVGYPVRKSFDDFHFRYRCLAPNSTDHIQLSEALVEQGILKEGEWAFGRSKVFMRNIMQQDLEAAREDALTDIVIRIQKNVRRLLERIRYNHFSEIREGLREAVTIRTEEALDNWLNMVGELPWNGSHLKEVREARALKARLEEERRVKGLLSEAIEARDLVLLLDAVKVAEKMVLEADIVEEARELIALIRTEMKCIEDLNASMASRVYDDICQFLIQAEELKLSERDEVRQGYALKARIEEEVAAIEALRLATESKDIVKIAECLDRCAELGLEDGEEIAAAKLMKEKLQKELDALNSVKRAIASRSLQQLTENLIHAQSLGLGEERDEIKEGLALKQRLEEEVAMTKLLTTTVLSSEISEVESVISQCEAMDFECEELNACKQRLTRLQKEKDCVSKLVAAIASNNATELSEAVDLANDLNLDVPELKIANDALEKLGAQNECLKQLRSVLKSSEIAVIAAAIKSCEELNLGGEQVVESARKAVARLTEMESLNTKLLAAIESRDNNTIRPLLESARDMNLASRFPDTVKSAEATSQTLGKEGKLFAALAEAMKTRDLNIVREALTHCEIECVTGPVMVEARAMYTKLQEEADLLFEISEAINDKDEKTVRALVEKADALEPPIAVEKMKPARIFLNRATLVADTKVALKAAMDASDLQALNVTMESVLELGMKGPLVMRAKKLIKKLEHQKELCSDVSAALKSLRLQTKGSDGIQENDLIHLQQTIEASVEDGLAEDNPVIMSANKFLERCQSILMVQNELAEVLEKPDAELKELKKVLDKAEDLDMEMDLVNQVKERIRDVEVERHEAAARGEDVVEEEWSEPEEDFDEDEVARQREERLERAANPKYEYTKFSGLRSPDEFAKGVLIGKRKIKERMLIWQSTVINKSLTTLSKNQVKTAQRLHKAMLGYCGDKTMSFPATLAHEIIQRGLECPSFVDEIYLLIIKHITQNPRYESQIRAWQIMCMAVGAFPPSHKFENYLLHFLVKHRYVSGEIGGHARYCLRRLESILLSGPSGFIPNIDEIQAFKERPPILATIELVDGTLLTEDLPITPDLSVAKVLEICTHFLELQDPRAEHFGIFVEDLEGLLEEGGPAQEELPAELIDLPKNPRPLRNDDYMGDVVMMKVRQNQAFKFVFKRKIFLKQNETTSEDPMFARLMFLQTQDEIIRGNIPIDDEETLLVCTAQALIIEMGEEVPRDIDGLLDIDVLEYIPYSWRAEHEVEQWAEMLIEQFAELDGISPDELQDMYVEAAKTSPLFGTHFFHAKKANNPDDLHTLPDRLILAFNCDGLHFLDPETMEILATYGYVDIYRWGANTLQFSLIIYSEEVDDTFDLNLHTTQGDHMTAVIMDYIKAIMESTE
eukprot:TRINITY_DN185_c0_g4_i1.p1 TRINITY_DN185_c0_g4~~TRINITY_DN185_c0_g4_i1.p1  ORF type:complete len:2063 (-),score=796.14 TRINITY_DN185_c0_g4_i1:239-6427(-)